MDDRVEPADEFRVDGQAVEVERDVVEEVAAERVDLVGGGAARLMDRGGVERPGARKWRFLFKCIVPLVGRLRAETMIVCMSNRRALYRGAFTVFGRKSNGATTRWQ